MANDYTLNDLIKDSIRVHAGMIAVWPQYNKEEVIDFDVATFNGSYALNNGTLAFVINNNLYVTRSTRKAYDALADFSKKYFYVPFSNGDYPKDKMYKWSNICAMQKMIAEQEFTQNCNEYCDKNQIGILDDNILSNCFIVPTDGVKIKHNGFENTYYPILKDTYFDSTVSDNLGKFCMNNGRVVFVYRDGRTMVTKGYRILNALRDAGYKETCFFVPFSNGEQIMDSTLRKRWDSIKK